MKSEIAPQMFVRLTVLVLLNPDLKRVDQVGILDGPSTVAGLTLVQADVLREALLRRRLSGRPMGGT